MMIASLGRRLGSLFYDSLLVGSLLALVAATAVTRQAVLSGEVMSPDTGPMVSSPWFSLTLLATLCLYFIGFWHRSGQTPGMRAWGLWLVAVDGSAPGIARSALRLAAAVPALLCLGGGYWWQLFDRRGCLHDLLSATRVMRLPHTTVASDPSVEQPQAGD